MNGTDQPTRVVWIVNEPFRAGDITFSKGQRVLDVIATQNPRIESQFRFYASRTVEPDHDAIAAADDGKIIIANARGAKGDAVKTSPGGDAEKPPAAD